MTGPQSQKHPSLNLVLNYPPDVSKIKNLVLDEHDLLWMAPTSELPFNSEQWFSFVNPSNARLSFLVYQDQKNLIGHLALLRIDHNKQSASLGLVYLLPEYRNRGFAFEMITLLHSWARNNLKLNSLELLVREKNEPAKKLYKKLGYTFVPNNTDPLRMKIDL